MSDNIQGAIGFIETELKQARHGLAHYSQMVANLEGTLRQISGIADTTHAAPANKKRRRKPKANAASVPKARRSRKIVGEFQPRSREGG